MPSLFSSLFASYGAPTLVHYNGQLEVVRYIHVKTDVDISDITAIIQYISSPEEGEDPAGRSKLVTCSLLLPRDAPSYNGVIEPKKTGIIEFYGFQWSIIAIENQSECWTPITVARPQVAERSRHGVRASA